MDKGTQTMIENLHKNTGKTLDQWKEIVVNSSIAKHGEIINYLKDQYGLTHGFANLIAHKTKGSDAGSASNQDELIANQYKGKEQFKTLYDKLITEIGKFGEDVEFATKNTYVSVRRKKQFAMLHPATKTRFEIGINLKGQEAKGKLEGIKASNSMCSHKINLTEFNDIDKEVIEWVKKAYDQAG